MSGTENEPDRHTKRAKRDSSYRSKASEKFKKLKEKAKYQVDEIENVFETVTESEYNERVLSRIEDDWIDDDGTGYVDDGREVFEEELKRDVEQKSTKSKGTKRKKNQFTANSSHGGLIEAISKMKPKKEAEVSGTDDMLSNLLTEIAGGVKPSSTINSNTNTQYLSSLRNIDRKLNSTKVLPLASKLSYTTPPVSDVTKVTDPLPKVEPALKKKLLDPYEPVDIPSRGKSDEVVDTKDVIAGEEKTFDKSDFFDSSSWDADMTHVDFTPTTISDVSNVNKMEDIKMEIKEELPVQLNGKQEEFVDDVNDFDYTSLFDEMDSKNSFKFFWWDAFEDERKRPGVVYLFGKCFNEQRNGFTSCCVSVQNVDRKLYFLPRKTHRRSGEPVTLEDLYNEVNDTVMKTLGVTQFKSKCVKKKFAFDATVPAESDYLEVRYAAASPPISDALTSGNTYSRIFGCNTSFLELLLLERKIKGPCWLDVGPDNCYKATNPISWCETEMVCAHPNHLRVNQSETLGQTQQPPPPLCVASISMHCCLNPQSLNTEIVMVACSVYNKYQVGGASNGRLFALHENDPNAQRICVFTKPTACSMLPVQFHEHIMNRTWRYKNFIRKMDSERGLLNYFINYLHRLDPDLVVGHDLLEYQMQVLKERLLFYQMNNTDKLGRLHGLMLTKYTRQLFVGRLVCDIKISAKELIRCRSYDLDTLCQDVLHRSGTETAPRECLEMGDVLRLYDSVDGIKTLITATFKDICDIAYLMDELNAIPLSMQITQIAGNVMSRTLLGGRAERNEFLLLHAFHERDFILPDKEKRGERQAKALPKAKKAAAYAGGLVLEPKVGFYDTFILLMDFNSLYPSIIQEYNICFTTISGRTILGGGGGDGDKDDGTGGDQDGQDVELPDASLPMGVLPEEIRKLVESRAQVKQMLKGSDIKPHLAAQYNIRQMALKLTANSMYGCLGFESSRFYAKPLAALVTRMGRDILKKTCELVQRKGYDIVYGDTDSIMVNTVKNDFDEVMQMGMTIKQDVNRLYKRIELDIDGVFRKLLLLKKKKYAALICSRSPKTNELVYKMEYKGLDLVRRDWSFISQEVGKVILEMIFSDTELIDDRITMIKNKLSDIRTDLEEGRVPLELLVITKQLSKPPESYTDTNAQPHVMVALRYNKSGGHLRKGDTVPYIICKDGTTNAAIMRAYHIEEVKNNKELTIDHEYYLSMQVFPVVSRLCGPIEYIPDDMIAEQLGVKVKHISHVVRSSQPDPVLENITQMEVRFRSAEPFTFTCIECDEENTINEPLAYEAIMRCANSKCTNRALDNPVWLANQLTMSCNRYVKQYYSFEMSCENPMCTFITNRVPMQLSGRFPTCISCQNGVMLRKHTEYELYTQLMFFQRLFTIPEEEHGQPISTELQKCIDLLRDTAEEKLQNCAYGVIDLGEMFSLFTIKRE